MNYTKEINLALKEFTSGNKKLAYRNLKEIFKKNSDDDQLRFNLAVIEQSLNLNEEAKYNYKYLINKNNNYKAMSNLYLIYLEEANYHEALTIINKLLVITPELKKVHKDKAFALYRLRKYKESINICQSFLKLSKDVDFLNIQGLNYFAKNEFDKSKQIFEKALKIDENNSSVLNSLGKLYHELRDSQNAEYYLLKAYNLKTDSYEIINNLAGFYREEGNYNKSIELYDQALNINPRNPIIINNLAKAYFDINQFDKAKEYCLKALALNKHDGNIQKILSLIYLRKQNYLDGWHYFDGRLNLSDFVERNNLIDNIRKKIFVGKKLNKKLKLLVLREQGVGDEILYGTIYKDLLNFCENVTIECDPRLKKIFCTSFPNYKNSFIEYGKISLNKNLINNFDIAIYAGSLGRYFRNDLEKFGDGCYLKPDNNLFKKSKKKIDSYENEINIGISWKSFKNRYANEKSLNLENFKYIFETQNCNFINLQYGNVNNEVENFNKKFKNKLITIENLDLMNDFDKLASVLKNLDLFISVSNSTAHLAASLGVKTLLIKPNNHAVFHYWNQPGSITPWYKSVTLLDKEKILNEENLLSKYLNV